MSILSNLLGIFFKFVYDSLSIFSAEPKSISFYAMTIIIATIIIKFLVLPLNIFQIKNQKKMAELQPEIEKIKKKYKNDQKTLAVKQQQLFKEANYNALSGCLPMIIQLIVLLAFYQVFAAPTKYVFDASYYNSISKNFFFISNLEAIDKSQILAILSAITTFLMSYISNLSPANKAMQNESSKGVMTSMMYIMPVIIYYMSLKFQAALVLYWVVSNLFGIFQQLFINKILAKDVEEKIK